jgi:hypothetical protein
LASQLRLDQAALPRRTGLIFPSSLPFETWLRLGGQIHLINDSSAWWLGDWLVYGQKRYPNRYQRAAENSALDYKTLRNYAWVARKVPYPRRRKDLSFAHHAEVAAVLEKEQDFWLEQAEEHGWSRTHLRREIRAAKSLYTNRAVGSSPSSPSGAPFETREDILILPIDAERRKRWQCAADHMGLPIEEWVKDLADRGST